MAIKIKQRDNKYVLEIEQETWLFEDRKALYLAIEDILNLKDRYGKIK